MRLIVTIAAVVALAAAAIIPTYATDKPADKNASSTAHEYTLGNPNAPVTIYEYASLTCGHCAQFTTTIMPDLQKQAIDTGKAKLIFRDFPLDGTALKAAALARCLPEEQYYAFIKMLFARKETWAHAKEPEKLLAQMAALAGLSPQTATACMTDTKKLDAIVANRMMYAEKYKIESTPTFVFNDGADVIAGAQPVAKFMAVINRLTRNENDTPPAPVAPPISAPAQTPAK